jgi:hypothetical protein
MHNRETGASLSLRSAEFINSLKAERDTRLKEIAEDEAAIVEAKGLLKEAMLNGGADAESKHRKEIRRRRQAIAERRERAFSIKNLQILNLTTGEVGTLQENKAKVLQVISKERGECLVTPSVSTIGHEKPIWLKGMDLNSVVDNDLLSFSNLPVFEVTGTTTYSSPLGGTNTVFVLQAIPEVREILASLTGNNPQDDDEPKLTAADQEQIDRHREQIKKDEARRNQEEQDEKKARELAERQEKDEKAADAKLRSADALRKAGKIEGYRTVLRELAAKYPETKAGKEAKSRLK